MKQEIFGGNAIKSLRIAALASIGLGLSACNYDGGAGIGYAGNGYANCDPYGHFDSYYSCDYGYGFSNIGYGGGWHSGFYYPGYGLYLFDNYGRRHAMRSGHRRYWAERRYHWNRDRHRGDYRDGRRHRRGDGHVNRRDTDGRDGNYRGGRSRRSDDGHVNRRTADRRGEGRSGRVSRRGQDGNVQPRSRGGLREQLQGRSRDNVRSRPPESQNSRAFRRARDAAGNQRRQNQAAGRAAVRNATPAPTPRSQPTRNYSRPARNTQRPARNVRRQSSFGNGRAHGQRRNRP